MNSKNVSTLYQTEERVQNVNDDDDDDFDEPQSRLVRIK